MFDDMFHSEQHSEPNGHAMASVIFLVCQRFLLQQDNDPKHKSKLPQEKQDGKLENMEWSAKS